MPEVSREQVALAKEIRKRSRPISAIPEFTAQEIRNLVLRILLGPWPGKAEPLVSTPASTPDSANV